MIAIQLEQYVTIKNDPQKSIEEAIMCVIPHNYTL